MSLDWSKLSAVAHQATAGYGGADNAFSLSVNAVDGGYFTIPASMDGQDLHYYAQDVDNNQREIGKGIYTAAGRTIARADENISQSTSGGLRVNFMAAPIVVVDWTGELFASLDSLLNVTGDGTPSGARTALELGTAATLDAPDAGDAATDEVVLGSDSRLGTVDLSNYYTKTEQDATDGAQDSALTTHKSSGDHDSRYYTKSQQDATDGAQDTAISQNATDILGTVVEVQAGTYIASIDNTDPRRPIINAQEQASPGGGEANVGENIGLGVEVYAGMNALALTMRTVIDTATIEWSQGATELSAVVPTGTFDTFGAAAAVNSSLNTHKSSSDHDARYHTKTEQDATDGAQDSAIASNTTHRTGAGDGASAHVSAGDRSGWNAKVESVVAGSNVSVDNSDPQNPVVSSTAAGGGWVDGTTVIHNIDGVQAGATGTSRSIAISSGQTIIASAMTANTTFDFTFSVLNAGEARHWSLIVPTAGFTPTFKVNTGANLTTSMDWYSLASGGLMKFTFVADTNGAWVDGMGELGAAA